MWIFIIVNSGIMPVLRVRLGMEDYDGVYAAGTLLLLPIAILLTAFTAFTAQRQSAAGGIPAVRPVTLHMLGVQCLYFLPLSLTVLLNLDPQRNMSWAVFLVVHTPALIAIVMGTRCKVLLFGFRGRRIAAGPFHDSVMEACGRMGVKIKRVLMSETGGWGHYDCAVMPDQSLWVHPDLLQFSREDVDAFVAGALWREKRQSAKRGFAVAVLVSLLFVTALSVAPNVYALPILLLAVPVFAFDLYCAMRFQEKDFQVSKLIGGEAYLRSLRSLTRVFPIAGARRGTDAITWRARQLVRHGCLEADAMNQILAEPPKKPVVSYPMPAFASAKVWYPF